MPKLIPDVGRLIIAAAPDDRSAAAFCDLFALGCILHDAGTEGFGKQLCETALRAAGIPPAAEEQIIRLLPDKAKTLLDASRCHHQVKALYGGVTFQP